VSALVVVGVGIVGGLAAVARFLLDEAIGRRAGRAFPFGILAVNLSGALALGVVAGVALQGDAYRLVAGGLIGTYTTFSTWVFDSHRLGEEGRPRLGALNIAVSLLLGLVAVWLGRRAGAAF
jgi:fluoride exporter